MHNRTNRDIPSLAVVIPCWNAEQFLARTIQSVLDQGYPNLSIIVIDDGSTDDSLDTIKAFGESVLWESGSNKGACVARNRGLAIASSTYVLFLDADDYLEGNIFEGFADSARTRADIIYAPAFKEFQTGCRESLSLPQTVDPRILALSWIRGSFVPPASIFWRRRFIDQLGGWNTKIARNQDGELMLRALFRSPCIAHTAKGCSIYVQHDSSDRISRRKSPEALRSVLDSLRYVRIEATKAGWMDADFARALHAEFYGSALQCFVEQELALGRRAVAEMRALQVRSHYGSWVSRSTAALIGLEHTGKLKRYWREFKGLGRVRA